MRKICTQKRNQEGQLAEGLRTLQVIPGGRSLAEIACHCRVPRSTVYMAEQAVLKKIRRAFPELADLLESLPVERNRQVGNPPAKFRSYIAKHL